MEIKYNKTSDFNLDPEGVVSLGSSCDDNIRGTYYDYENN